MSTNITKKRKFVADGVFYAELNEVRQPTDSAEKKAKKAQDRGAC
jgi:hypothetical protein